MLRLPSLNNPQVVLCYVRGVRRIRLHKYVFRLFANPNTRLDKSSNFLRTETTICIKEKYSRQEIKRLEF